MEGGPLFLLTTAVYRTLLVTVQGHLVPIIGWSSLVKSYPSVFGKVSQSRAPHCLNEGAMIF